MTEELRWYFKVVCLWH